MTDPRYPDGLAPPGSLPWVPAPKRRGTRNVLMIIFAAIVLWSILAIVAIGLSINTSLQDSKKSDGKKSDPEYQVIELALDDAMIPNADSRDIKHDCSSSGLLTFSRSCWYEGTADYADPGRKAAIQSHLLGAGWEDNGLLEFGEESGQDFVKHFADGDACVSLRSPPSTGVQIAINAHGICIRATKQLADAFGGWSFYTSTGLPSRFTARSSHLSLAEAPGLVLTAKDPRTGQSLVIVQKQQVRIRPTGTSTAPTTTTTTTEPPAGSPPLAEMPCPIRSLNDRCKLVRTTPGGRAIYVPPDYGDGMAVAVFIDGTRLVITARGGPPDRPVLTDTEVDQLVDGLTPTPRDEIRRSYPSDK